MGGSSFYNNKMKYDTFTGKVFDQYVGLDGLTVVMINIISPYNLINTCVDMQKTLWHKMVGYRMSWKEPNQLLITWILCGGVVTYVDISLRSLVW